MHSILGSLEMEIREDDGARAVVVPPPFRMDVMREIDVVEEVARIYGMDRIPERSPVAQLAAIGIRVAVFRLMCFGSMAPFLKALGCPIRVWLAIADAARPADAAPHSCITGQPTHAATGLKPPRRSMRQTLNQFWRGHLPIA